MTEKKGLTRIDVTSGTAQDGPTQFRGFVTVRATADDDSVLLGQLSPDELRSMAMQFLGVAEAAEQDAIVFTILTRDMELSPAVAGGLVIAMRNERSTPQGPFEQDVEYAVPADDPAP